MASRLFGVVLAMAPLSVVGVPAVPVNASGSAQERTALGWLTARDYADLDQYFSELQRRYETRQVSDVELLDGFRALYDAPESDDNRFDEWVRRYPKSYASNVARGAHFYRMAWKSRGTAFLADTPRGQITEMERLLVVARQDLEVSMTLTSKPLLTALYMLNVEQLVGSRGEQRHWLDAGNQIDPGNFLIRRRYMVTLEPRWGGSYPEMTAFVEESRRQGVTAAMLDALNALIEDDEADTERRNGNTLQANSHLRAELALLNQAGVLPTSTEWTQYAKAAWALRRYDEARKGLEQLQQQNVQEGWIYSELTWIYVNQMHDMPKAWAAANQGAVLNDAWSQLTVGKTLYLGCSDIGLKADRTAGLAWVRKAADQGFAEASTFLSQHVE